MRSLPSHPSLLPLLLLLLSLLSLHLSPTLSADCVVDHHPMTLLTFDLSTPSAAAVHRESVKMQPVDATMAKLAAIKGRVAVISIAGGYRSGKSFFLNQLLPRASAEQRGHFMVGDTTEAQTEEVQVHVIPGCALQSFGLQDSDLTVLFMDTPGLYSPNRPVVFDSQLLALLNLLSSVVLYNNKGVVERTDIDQLSAAMETAFLLSFFSSRNGEQQRVDLDRPHLLWLLQSLALTLTTTSEKEYLLLKLNQTDQGRKGAASYYDRFTRFFASIDARVFPYPSEHTKDLDKLQELTWEELTQEYRGAIEGFRPMVVSRAFVKKVGGAELTGELLVDLVKTWVEIMAVKVADLTEQGTEVLMREIIKKEVERAKETYQQQMSAVALPTPRARLQEKSDEVVRAITRGKEVMARYMRDVHDAIQPLLVAFQQQNDALLVKEGTKLTELAASVLSYGQAEVQKLQAKGGVYGVEQLDSLEKDMEARWSAGVAKSSEAGQSLAGEHKDGWSVPWGKLKAQSKAGNSATSLSLCMQRAQLVHDYYQTRSPLLDWQTDDEFRALINKLSTSSEPIPPHILGDADDVVCAGEGQLNEDVQSLYSDTARAFAHTHRLQLAMVTMMQVGLLMLSVYAVRKVSTYINALGGGALRAREVDAAEGSNCYLMLLGAVVAGGLAKTGVDGVWSGMLAWSMALVLLSAGGLALKLRMKTKEQRSKDLHENSP